MEITPKAMEITPKACGDRTNRKKTLNYPTGKVYRYGQDLFHSPAYR